MHTYLKGDGKFLHQCDKIHCHDLGYAERSPIQFLFFRWELGGNLPPATIVVCVV